MNDVLHLGGKDFTSRLILGSGKFSLDLITAVIEEGGGEIITLGSDAHEVKDVGCVIRERQELLKDCGFRYFTTFTGGEPAFQKL